ncbi:hypothetical protein D9M68_719960 [compost metagenome]
MLDDQVARVNLPFRANGVPRLKMRRQPERGRVGDDGQCGHRVREHRHRQHVETGAQSRNQDPEREAAGTHHAQAQPADAQVGGVDGGERHHANPQIEARQQGEHAHQEAVDQQVPLFGGLAVARPACHQIGQMRPQQGNAADQHQDADRHGPQLQHRDRCGGKEPVSTHAQTVVQAHSRVDPSRRLQRWQILCGGIQGTSLCKCR